MGVGISIPKSVTPSELCGLEFASKLISTEGNLSPLPFALLTTPGLVNKFQFVDQVVKRIITDNIQRGPSLEILLRAVFGQRLSEKLGGL
jgi:hypothetical protein